MEATPEISWSNLINKIPNSASFHPWGYDYENNRISIYISLDSGLSCSEWQCFLVTHDLTTYLSEHLKSSGYCLAFATDARFQLKLSMLASFVLHFSLSPSFPLIYLTSLDWIYNIKPLILLTVKYYVHVYIHIPNQVTSRFLSNKKLII